MARPEPPSLAPFFLVVMVGKDPHRPQGKTKDMEHMAHAYAEHDVPRQAPSEKERAQMDEQAMRRGGQRPGVESRMRDSSERREEQE